MHTYTHQSGLPSGNNAAHVMFPAAQGKSQYITINWDWFGRGWVIGCKLLCH